MAASRLIIYTADEAVKRVNVKRENVEALEASLENSRIAPIDLLSEPTYHAHG